MMSVPTSRKCLHDQNLILVAASIVALIQCIQSSDPPTVEADHLQCRVSSRNFILRGGGGGGKASPALPPLDEPLALQTSRHCWVSIKMQYANIARTLSFPHVISEPEEVWE
jgi:hypothetical protein